MYYLHVYCFPSENKQHLLQGGPALHEVISNYLDYIRIRTKTKFILNYIVIKE